VGGHTVSGHVHTTARISAIEDSPNNKRMTLTLADPAWMKYILPKGYVAVDGTSLTVGEVRERRRLSCLARRLHALSSTVY